MQVTLPRARAGLDLSASRLLSRGTLDEAQEPANILHRSRTFYATDPRNKFYGLLGILKADSVEVDYTKSIARVYTDCAIHALKFGLRVLSLVSHRLEYDEHSDLPSWGLNLNQAPENTSMQSFRLGEDKRAASKYPRPDIDTRRALGGNLRLSGIRCDTISTCSDVLWIREQQTYDVLLELVAML